MEGEGRWRPAGIMVKMLVWMCVWANREAQANDLASWVFCVVFFGFFFCLFLLLAFLYVFWFLVCWGFLWKLVYKCTWKPDPRLLVRELGQAQLGAARRGTCRWGTNWVGFSLPLLLFLPCSIVHPGLWLFPQSYSPRGQSCIPGFVLMDFLDVLKWVDSMPVKFSFSVTHCFFKKETSVVAMESPAYLMRLNHRIYSAATENIWKYVCWRAAVLSSLAAL